MVASRDRSNGRRQKRLTSKTSSAMTRIDRNSANTQIYSYEIKQSVSKNFFLLLRTTPRLTALHTVYFPAITRNGFCFHIRKIISRRPLPSPKNRDIHIVEFFFRDSIYNTTIDIITNNIFFSIFKHVYIRPVGWQYQFACIVLSGPPADGPFLHVVFYPDGRLMVHCYKKFFIRTSGWRLIALIYYGWNYLNWLMVVQYSRGESASPSTGGRTIEECHKGWTSGKLVKSGPRICEHCAITQLTWDWHWRSISVSKTLCTLSNILRRSYNINSPLSW